MGTSLQALIVNLTDLSRTMLTIFLGLAYPHIDKSTPAFLHCLPAAPQLGLHQ